MKIVKIEIPSNMADHLVTFTVDNKIKILLSYQRDGFFDDRILAYCFVPEDAETIFRDEFKNYIK